MSWLKETERALEKRGREEGIVRETRLQVQQKELKNRLDAWEEKLAIVVRLGNEWKEWGVDKMVVEIRDKLWPNSKIGNTIYCFPPKCPSVKELKIWKINLNENPWRGDIHEYLSRLFPNFVWSKYNESFYGDREKRDQILFNNKHNKNDNIIDLLMREQPADYFNDPYLKVEIRHMVEERWGSGEQSRYAIEFPLEFDFCLFTDHIKVNNQIIPLNEIRDRSIVRKKIDQSLSKLIMDRTV